MSLSKVIITSSLVAATQAKDVKLGIFSDIHLNLNYNPDSSDNSCTLTNQTNQFVMNKIPQSEVKIDKKALLGRLGCDAPQALVEYMFQLFNQATLTEPVDYIILNGDLIAHGIAQDAPSLGSYKQDLYQLLKDTHTKVQQLFKEYMPDTPVFLALGNNDSKYHDNAPFQEDKNEFYSFLYDLWFKNFPANAKYAAAVHDTFMDGGYYKIDANEKLSFLSFNTLQYNLGQVSSQIGPEAENQFKWLENNLKDSSKKYIIFEHIYAGGRIKHDDKSNMQDLWGSDYKNRFFDLLLQYKDQIVIELAGHDHWEDLRYYEDSDGNSYRNLFIAAGVGLDHNQLPGFNTLKVDENTLTAKDLELTVLDITKTYGLNDIPPLDSIPYHQINFKNDYGINDESVSSIKQKITDFKNGNISSILNYLSDKLGFDPKDPDQLKQGEETSASWSLISSSFKNADNFICQSSRARTGQKIQDCVNALHKLRQSKIQNKEKIIQSNAFDFIQ